jgi:hypothetical protein
MTMAGHIGRKPVQDPRPREWVLTMLGSAALTFAILMWQHKTEGTAPALPVSQSPRPAQSAPVPQPAMVQPVSSVVAAAPKRPAAPIAAVPEDNPGGPALPLTYNVFNRRGRHKIEGFVRNMSPETLSLTLQVMNASGEAAAQQNLVLAPAEQKNFGTDSGLNMQSGDKVIFRSPPYQDTTIEIP